jgi:hypothetical protein
MRRRRKNQPFPALMIPPVRLDKNLPMRRLSPKHERKSLGEKRAIREHGGLSLKRLIEQKLFEKTAVPIAVTSWINGFY